MTGYCVTWKRKGRSMDYPNLYELSLTRKRKLGNNTYFRDGENKCFVVSLHGTDIVTLFSNGDLVFNSGGFRTTTTKDRMNWFMPPGFVLFQENSVWYILDRKTNRKFTFADGIHYHANTESWHNIGPDVKTVLSTKKRIQKYAKEYVDAFMKGEVANPSGADCFICCCGGVGDVSHFESHFEEQYYVPRLLLNAIDIYPVNGLALLAIQDIWAGKECHDYSKDWVKQSIKKSITRYLYRQFGLAS